MSYQHFGAALMRTPFNPVNHIQNRSSRPNKSDFLALCNDGAFDEAIYLASLPLSEETNRWLDNENPDARSEEAYHRRMSFRCTPFGIFSGVSLVSLSDKTAIEIQDTDSFFRACRIDNAILCTIAEQLLQQPDFRFSLKYSPNNTRYALNDKIRYVEFKNKNNNRIHELVSVDTNDYLERIFEVCRFGLPFQTIVNQVVDNEVNEQDLKDFVEELINSKILLSEAEAKVTGNDYFEQLYQIVQRISEENPTDLTQKTANQLKEIKNLLLDLNTDYKSVVRSSGFVIQTNRAVDLQSTPTKRSIYENIYNILNDLLTHNDKPNEQRNLLQVDLYKTLEQNTINQHITNSLNDTLRLFYRISSPMKHSNLDGFAKKFYDKYEHREVPILEALDNEIGIGYPPPATNETQQDNKTERWHQYLLEKYVETLQNQASELVISEDEVAKIFTEKPVLSEPFLSSMFKIVAANAAALDAGDFKLVNVGFSTPNSVSLLARFCHTDPAIEAFTKHVAATENQALGDVLVAEIVHLPHDRIGNISYRPLLRTYEIPILTQANVAPQNQLSLDDLYLVWHNNKVHLKSRLHNKLVLPRLTNAHNYNLDTINFYKFLSDMQYQYVKTFPSFSVGNLTNFKYIPRIVFKNTVLQPAQWRVTIDQTDKEKDTQLLEKILAFWNDKKLPREVILPMGDNEIPICIDDYLCQKIVLKEIKQRKEITVTENLLIDARSNFVTDKKGNSYTAEFILPLCNPAAYTDYSTQLETLKTFDLAHIKRSFEPSSEWLYAKIYASPKVVDKLIAKLNDWTTELLNEDIVAHFFFIRYTDPDHHLRLRFWVNDAHQQYVMQRINEACRYFLAQKQISKIQYDTYIRELERYQPHSPEDFEQVFFVDSFLVQNTVSWVHAQGNEDARFLVACKGVFNYLDAAQLDWDKQLDFVTRMAKNYRIEFGNDNFNFKNQVSDIYRKKRNELEDFISTKSYEDPFLNQQFGQHQGLTQQIFSQYSMSEQALFDLLASYIHMFINRLFITNQRYEELMTYSIVEKQLASKIARAKKGVNVEAKY
jgi:thiopeptide-type bacteriocin biosynthesis protein